MSLKASDLVRGGFALLPLLSLLPPHKPCAAPLPTRGKALLTGLEADPGMTPEAWPDPPGSRTSRPGNVREPSQVIREDAAFGAGQVAAPAREGVPEA